MPAEDLQKFQEEWHTLEKDLIDTNIRWRKWAVAAGAVMALLCLASFVVAGIVIRAYGQPVPVQVAIWNPETGTLTETQLLEEKTTWGEVTDTDQVSRFVWHYESYNFYNQQLHYDAVSLMAAPEVSEPWQKQYQGPKGLDKTLGDSETRTVKIHSVLLDRRNSIATVRYSVTRKERSSPLADPPNNYIVTFAYTYDNVRLTADQRLISPYGFRALSWDRREEVR